MGLRIAYSNSKIQSYFHSKYFAICYPYAICEAPGHRKEEVLNIYFQNFVKQTMIRWKKKANKHHTIPSEANAPQRLPPRWYSRAQSTKSQLPILLEKTQIPRLLWSS